MLYIGDSITHGYEAPSYRWALHKIFVDNGIKYDEIGVEVGNNTAVGDKTSLNKEPHISAFLSVICTQR